MVWPQTLSVCGAVDKSTSSLASCAPQPFTFTCTHVKLILALLLSRALTCDCSLIQSIVCGVGAVCATQLDEALAQWKTRTHIQKYVYDISSQPHLGRSSLSSTPMNAELLAQPEALRNFLAQDPKAGY